MASGLQPKENQEENKLKENQEDREVNKEKESEEKHKTSKHKWYHVNPNAISSKCAYFFECAMRSGLQPNLVMFLTSIGLNKAEAGFIVGLRMIGMILGGPFWGLIADKWHCHRIVILLMCITSLLTISTQPFVGLHFGNPETNKCPYVKDTALSSINVSSKVINASYYDRLFTGNYLQNNALSVSNRSHVTKSLKTSLYKNLTVNSQLLLDQNITFYSSNNARSRVLSQERNPINKTSKVSESNQNKIQKDTHTRTFGTLYFAMFSINFILSFAEGSAVGFVDTGTMRRSQLATTRPVAYGRQRMFSSFGGAFGILITNLAIDYFPASNITCYTGIFVVYGLFTVCYCISTIALFQGLSFYSKPTDLDNEDKCEQTTDQKRLLGSQKYEKNDISLNKSRNNLRKTLFRTLSRPETIFFYLTTFVSGLEYSQSMNFLYPYLREMDAPSILLTLSVVFSNFASIIGFAFCQDMVQFLGGTWRAFAFSFLMYLVRYFGVSYIQNPWFVLIFQPIHALSAVMFVAGGLIHLRQTCPIPVMTTLISLFNTTHYGLGTIIGSSISGIIYEKYGGRTLFKSTSMLALVWLLVLIVYIVLVVRKRERKEKEGTGKTNGLLLMEPVQDKNIKEEKA